MSYTATVAFYIVTMVVVPAVSHCRLLMCTPCWLPISIPCWLPLQAANVQTLLSSVTQVDVVVGALRKTVLTLGKHSGWGRLCKQAC